MNNLLQHIKIVTAILLGTLPVGSAFSGQDATVALEPTDADQPRRVVLANGEGAELVFYRHLWQAMRVRTPLGTEADITDLFMYQTRINGSGDYWTRPERWDAELTFRVGRSGDDGAAVEITGRRFPAVKTVNAAIYPGEPAVYVVSRLEVSEQSTIDSDTQLIYLGEAFQDASEPAIIIIDGEDHSHLFDKDVSIHGDVFLYTYLPGENLSLAIITVPRNDHSIKVRRPFIYRNRFGGNDQWGRELIIRGIHEEELLPGEELDLRYVIYWNDGDRLDEVKALTDYIQSGEFAEKFPEHIHFESGRN